MQRINGRFFFKRTQDNEKKMAVKELLAVFRYI